MKKALFLGTALGLMLAQTAFAQPTSTQSPEKIVQAADEAYAKSNTYSALELYQKAYDNNPNNTYVISQLAQTHEKLRDYKEAVIWYERLVKADASNAYPLARFKYAYILKLNGKYSEAINEFNTFKNTYNGQDADRYKQLAEIEIAGAQWALANPNAPEKVVVDNVGAPVNTPSSEDGAFGTGRGVLYFSSLKTDTLIYVDNTKEADRTAKIYMSTRSEDGKGKWSDVKEFNADKLVKSGFHAVQPTFSADGSKFYFVRTQLEGNAVKNSRIFVCTNKDGVLSEPVSLSFNSPNYICKNPSVGVIDGVEYLFFSSNKEGGKGGFDLWYAEINADGTTKEPLNMSAINTIADDITPFYDARENILYFSSEGYPTVGGFDVFRSKKSGNTFAQPENMGFGVNSRVDDFGFRINQEGNDDCYGYVVSNRPGTTSMKSETCCDDIFSVLMPDRCDIVATVQVMDEDSKKPLKGTTVQVIDKATGKVVDEQTNQDGNSFTFNLTANKEYDIVAKKDGYEKPAAQTKISTLKQDIGEVTAPIALEKSTSLKEMGFAVATFNAKDQQPLSGVNLYLVEVSTGNEVAKTTGSDKATQSFSNVSRDKAYKIIGKKDGFLSESRTLTLEEVKAGGIQRLYLKPLELPLFYNVLFDFDKSDIRSGAADTLGLVLNALQDHPDLVVEVRGHTDALGKNDYNQKLSEKRAQSATNWLISKGIAKERLIAKGYGKLEPIADNDVNGNDNPDGRQQNRRVEFKIIKGGETLPTEAVEPTKPVNPKDAKMNGESGKATKDAKDAKMNGEAAKATKDAKDAKMGAEKKN